MWITDAAHIHINCPELLFYFRMFALLCTHLLYCICRVTKADQREAWKIERQKTGAEGEREKRERKRDWSKGRWRAFYRISQPVWKNWWKPASKLSVSSPPLSHVSSVIKQLRSRPDISLHWLEGFPHVLCPCEWSSLFLTTQCSVLSFSFI